MTVFLCNVILLLCVILALSALSLLNIEILVQSNQERSQHAKLASLAALEQGLASMEWPDTHRQLGGRIMMKTGAQAESFWSPALRTDPSRHVDDAPCAHLDTQSLGVLSAWGQSDDGTAQHRRQVCLYGLPLLRAQMPIVPVLVVGRIQAHELLTIHNTHHAQTIWTSQAVDTPNTIHTHARFVLHDGSSRVFEVSHPRWGLGIDVTEQDHLLANLSVTELFDGVFTLPAQRIKQLAIHLSAVNQWDASSERRGVIWIDQPARSLMGQMGSVTHPLHLLVMQDLVIDTPTTLTGILYVQGTLVVNAPLRLQGALVINPQQRDADTVGLTLHAPMTIDYQPGLFDAEALINTGLVAMQNGTHDQD